MRKFMNICSSLRFNEYTYGPKPCFVEDESTWHILVLNPLRTNQPTKELAKGGDRRPLVWLAIPSF
jgi:hypothetical protein